MEVSLLRKFLLSLLLVLVAALPAVAAEKLVVAGSGTNLDITRVLANAYMAKHPGVVIEVPESIGSGGAVKQAATNAIAAGLLSRPLDPKEVELGLRYVPYARVAVVFAVHTSVTGVTNLSSEQLVAIFSGKVTNWKEVGGPDKDITVLTREAKDSSRLLFTEVVRGWRQLVDRADAIVSLTDQDNNSNLSQTRYGIGFTDAGAIQMTNMKVRAISLDGIAPTAENVNSGKYRLLKELAFCFKGSPQGTIKDFADFVSSAEGAKVIADNGFVPVK